MSLLNYLKSSILSKIVMGATGVILVLFIVGHTVGNLQVFLGKEVFNNYAYFLQQGIGELLWIVRISLFVCLILHVWTSIVLKLRNRAAKPVKYEVKKYVRAKMTSRMMIWTGIMILSFLIFHLLHFTVGVVNKDIYNHQDYYVKNSALYVKQFEGDPKTLTQGQIPPAMLEEMLKGYVKHENGYYASPKDAQILYERHDAYYMVIKNFQQPLISFFYILGVVLLGFHLNHAIQSAFQTLGFNHPRYFPKIVAGSTVLSILITLCLVSIPLTIMLKLVGAAV